MAVEKITMIKRTLWIAKCDCGCEASKEVTENPPRETRFPCGNWAPFVEKTFTSEEYKK